MMLLKRLLLPGKGDVIICIFLLVNVLLLWCTSGGGGCGEPVTMNINSPITIITSLLLYNSRFCGVVLLTYYFFVGSLQFPSSSASEVVLISQDPTQKPVLKKTDPPSVMMAVGMEDGRGGGGGGGRSSPFHDYNYNKRRRRPVYVHSSNSSSSRNIRTSDLFSSNQTVNNVSLSVGDGGSKGANSSGGNPSDETKSSHNNSSSRNSDNLRRTTTLNRRHHRRNDASVNSKSKSSSVKNSSSKSTVVTLKRRKGRTRSILLGNDSSVVGNSRKPKLLKEITLLNRQNCLAKLLCGVQVAQPPTKSSSALNDYAYLVKAFFDRFSIRGIVTDVVDAAFALEEDRLDILDDEENEEEEQDEEEEEDDQDDDDESSDRKRKRKRKKNRVAQPYAGAQFHRARVPPYERYEPKYYEEYDRFLDEIEYEHVVDDNVPDFMEPDLLRKRKGRNMTFVAPFKGNCEGINGTGIKGIRVGSKSRNVPVDINRVRRRRGIKGEVKRGFMGFYNPRFDKTAYLNKRQLELESTENHARQLNIAEEIAARLRSPRQCRLLNWFGTSNSKTTGSTQSTQTVPQSNAMTTTITTITNTGGMVGNLNGMQNLPQPAAAAAAAPPQTAHMNPMNSMNNPGSQVVTVIQQSPVTNPTQPSTLATSTESLSATGVKAAAAATSMLKGMGQKASNAMNAVAESVSEAGNVATDVASHIGSTICPFTIAELQDLILKAQKSQFPHFLTTTRRPPGNFLPGLPIAQKKPHIQLQQALQQAALPKTPARKPPPPRPPPPPPPTRAATTTTVATTTIKIKSTKAPPPPSTTVAVILARNPPPPSSRHDPATFAQMFSSFQDTPIQQQQQYNHNHHHSPQYQHNFNQQPTPPSHYQMNSHYSNHYQQDTMQTHNPNYHHQPQQNIPHFQHATPPSTHYHLHAQHQHNKQWGQYQHQNPQYLPYDQPTHPPASLYSSMAYKSTVPPPIFPPSPVVFPTFMTQKQEASGPDHQTRLPDDIPAVGIAGEDDDDFEDEPYVTYESKHSSPSIHPPPPTLTPTPPAAPSTKKPRPIPKWMTTTTPLPEDDELLSYNDIHSIPKYTYSKHHQQLQQTQLLQTQQKQHHHNVQQQQQQPSGIQTFKAPHLANLKDPIDIQNYVREFEQPPVVIDTNAVYRPGSGTGLVPYHQQPLEVPQAVPNIQPQGKPMSKGRPQKTQNTKALQRTPSQRQQQKNKNASEENDGSSSDEEESSDNSGSSEGDDDEEEGEDDEDGSDEGGSSNSSGARASMMKVEAKQKQAKRPPVRSSVSASEEEEEEGSDEREQKEEEESSNEEEESDEEEEDEEGKRDRLGAPAGKTHRSTPITTKRPMRKNKEKSEGSGFFSNFIGSFSSYFNRNDVKKNFFQKRIAHVNPTSSKPSSYFSKSKLPQPDANSDEDTDENDSDESEEDSIELPKQARINLLQQNSQKKKSQSLISSLISAWIPQTTMPTTTTRAPVILEEIGNWAKKFIRSKLQKRGFSQEDDSGEEVLQQNPVRMYKEAIIRKTKNMKQKLKDIGLFSKFLGNAKVKDNWLTNDLQGDQSYNHKHNPPPSKRRAMGFRLGKALETTGTTLKAETSGPPGGISSPQPLD